MKSLKTVALISGGGSTNRKVLEEQRSGGKLYGLVETVAIISNDFQAGGLQRAMDIDFPKKHIHIVNPAMGKKSLGEQLLLIFDYYNPDYFTQFGWYPLTPQNVINYYKGINQHLGPGGQHMYYGRRLFAHFRFCEIIGEKRPVPIFCQLVAPNFDDGDAICAIHADFAEGESVEEVATQFLPLEHEVQIEGLRLLATETANPFPVPRVYLDLREKKIMDRVREEANIFFKRNEAEANGYRFSIKDHR